MIKVNDVIFKFYDDSNVFPKDGDFSYFGNEGNKSLAFDTYALGYKNGADAIYEKFCCVEGDFALLDTLVFPMCFLYRHMTELLIKYLYRKHSYVNDEKFKDFINKGHKLMPLWNATKPFITILHKRVETSVSITSIEHYIKEISNFDEDSFRMRYPIDKELSNTNKGKYHLDIHNLHSKMNAFYEDVMKFSHEIEGQLFFVDINQDKIERFEAEYKKVKDKILIILELREEYDKCNKQFGRGVANIVKNKEMMQAKSPNPINSYNNYIKTLTDNQIITLQAIYYCGQRHYNLPIEKDDKKCDYLKGCVLELEELGTSYDERIDRQDCVDFLHSKQFRIIKESFLLALDTL